MTFCLSSWVSLVSSDVRFLSLSCTTVAGLKVKFKSESLEYVTINPRFVGLILFGSMEEGSMLIRISLTSGTFLFAVELFRSISSSRR